MFRLAVALLLCLAVPAFATQDRWPALFDVTGVAGDDVLNIRTGPDPASERIGSYAPSARDIEVIAPNERQTWGMVNVDGRVGWVSLRYLQRQPGQWLGAPIGNVRCVGTEPFWSLTRRGDAVTWSTPEGEADGSVTVTLDTIARRTTRGFVYAMAGDRGHVILELAACSDGMSDRAFGISAAVTRNLDGAPELFAGCCSLQPGAGASD